MKKMLLMLLTIILMISISACSSRAAMEM